MQRKTALLSVGLAAMLLLAGCSTSLSPGSAAAAPGEDAQPAKTIEVGATGTAETTPDQAIVEVAVEVNADSASAARQQLSENATQLREALNEAGIEDDQIRTRHYDIDRDHRRPRPGPEGERESAEPTYRGFHAFEIRLTDLSKTGEAIDVAVESGASRIDGVRFTLSEEKRRQLREQALEDAMDNARSQADTLAARGNLSVDGVHAIQTNERTHYRPYEASAVAADGGGGTSIESGPVTVRTQVRVTYNATGA